MNVSLYRQDQFFVNRQLFNEKTLEDKYSFQKYKSENVLNSSKNYIKKYYSPNLNCTKRFLFNRLPVISWISKYNVRENLLKDFIGGLTIGVVQIPQSMAYSIMAGLPPINGLYVSFFSVIIYFLFGTSRHLSLGTYGIVSLMIAASIEKFEGKLYPKSIHISNSKQRRYGLDNLSFRSLHEVNEVATISKDTEHEFLSADPDEAKIMIASCLAFFTGIIQILFSILHAGVVTKYLSDVIVAAFTTGAAYHVVVSQINSLLGIDIYHENNPFKLIENFIDIFKEIQNSNLATLIVSFVSITMLYMVKHFINQKYKKKLIAPVPIELIVVVLGTLLSYFFEFNKKFKVKIVGPIPLGIPSPKIPPLKLFTSLIGDSFSIAIVSFALNISMGKLFSKKYNYNLDSNQELFSYGLGNLISSFFKGFPSCVGLSRCVILEGTGAKTQLFSVISSVLVLVVIVGIGFLFKSLPICCLASIIVVALLTMLTEVKQIIPIYKRSKIEALAWLATFLGVMILDVDYGLYIGICFSLLLIIFQSQRTVCSVMGNIPKTDIYESITVCEDAREIENVKILRYESSIYYANVENFFYKIVKNVGINPNEIIHKINKKKNYFTKKIKAVHSKKKKQNRLNSTISTQGIAQLNEENEGELNEEQALNNQMEQEIENILNSINIKDVILDFSCVNFIDSMGIETMIKLYKAYKECRVQLHLSYCKKCIIQTFNRSPSDLKFEYDYIYPTTHDAVLKIFQIKLSNISIISDSKSISLNLEEENSDKELLPNYLQKEDLKIFDQIVS